MPIPADPRSFIPEDRSPTGLPPLLLLQQSKNSNDGAEACIPAEPTGVVSCFPPDSPLRPYDRSCLANLELLFERLVFQIRCNFLPPLHRER